MFFIFNSSNSRRERQYKWVSATGWRGLEWEIGDKGNFHFMKQINDDFVQFEDQLWKPVAQEQILNGYRKFWGLAEIISKDEPSKALNTGFTHIAFNFMTKKGNMPNLGSKYNSGYKYAGDKLKMFCINTL